MKSIIHRAESQGHANYGWLDTRHTFSFARYYDPQRMQFGALRVLKDDVVVAGRGFPTHAHDNRELFPFPFPAHWRIATAPDMKKLFNRAMCR